MSNSLHARLQRINHEFHAILEQEEALDAEREAGLMKIRTKKDREQYDQAIENLHAKFDQRSHREVPGTGSRGDLTVPDENVCGYVLQALSNRTLLSVSDIVSTTVLLLVSAVSKQIT